MSAIRRVAVIGTGAMGGGVVQSLVRAGFTAIARDIRPEAQDLAVRHGALPAASAADAARASEAIVILVVDAAQVETVLFGEQGVTSAPTQPGVVLVSSTVAPDYVRALAPRLAAFGIALLDAPVSGGPLKAAAGTMTLMMSGDERAQSGMRPLLERITGRLFALGPRVGDASTFKIVNNLLAAANLAAGAEALAIAHASGLDLPRMLEVIRASSGASWILGDRGPRALIGDHGVHAATKLLCKDVGIAAAWAERLRVEAPFAQLALRAFADAAADGCADDDDSVVLRRAIESADSRTRA
jgi:L-threonate 2-dehydrogenase